VSVEDIENIRRAIGIKVNSPAAEYLDGILAEYEADIEEARSWATSQDGKHGFEGFAGVLDVIANRIIKAAGMARHLGHDWETPALKLHDGLRAFANKNRELAQDIAAKGGPGNLYTRLYGPPEWRLAINLAALYRSRKPTPGNPIPKRQRDRFIAAVYTPVVEHIRCQRVGRGGLQARHARVAYTFAGKAVPIAKRMVAIRDQLRQDAKLKAKERAALKESLETLEQEWALLQDKAPYAFLIGKQPDT
jgi:hypothetical protein